VTANLINWRLVPTTALCSNLLGVRAFVSENDTPVTIRPFIKGADIMPASSLLHDLEMSFNNPELSDVTFIVEGKKIYANKFILALRCEKFRCVGFFF